MKVMTIFGTRPEIIRLSLVMKILDQHCEHTMVHTGQNFDDSLSDIFFRELEVRAPDVHLGIRSTTFADQAAQIIAKADQILEEHRPDRILILGDTNSALSAIPAARRRIPIFHMEAGNRCYDDRVPEELNRRIVDHCSTVLLPYTENSKTNLLREGIDVDRIIVTGNPIFEVLQSFESSIEASGALDALGVKPFEYFLATLHRAENVDERDRLSNLMAGLHMAADEFAKPVILSTHPRTAEKIASFGINIDEKKVRLIRPFGLFDFVKLEKHALAVLTDSGTVQEECAILKIPNVTLRDVTERPETVECGSNILSGSEPMDILRSVRLSVAQPANWEPPKGYLSPDVSHVVSNAVLGYSRYVVA